MIRKKSPCMKCEKRTIGCHSSCEGYKSWVEETKAFSQAVSAVKHREMPEKVIRSDNVFREIRKRKWK